MKLLVAAAAVAIAFTVKATIIHNVKIAPVSSSELIDAQVEVAPIPAPVRSQDRQTSRDDILKRARYRASSSRLKARASMAPTECQSTNSPICYAGWSITLLCNQEVTGQSPENTFTGGSFTDCYQACARDDTCDQVSYLRSSKTCILYNGQNVTPTMPNSQYDAILITARC